MYSTEGISSLEWKVSLIRKNSSSLQQITVKPKLWKLIVFLKVDLKMINIRKIKKLFPQRQSH